MENNSSTTQKARMVDINHVALEVGNIEQALAFYGRIFEFTLRGHSDGQAFIDMGDQFTALMEGQTLQPDHSRHFGSLLTMRKASGEGLKRPA